jgi:hypothetical protein
VDSISSHPTVQKVHAIAELFVQLLCQHRSTMSRRAKWAQSHRTLQHKKYTRLLSCYLFVQLLCQHRSTMSRRAKWTQSHRTLQHKKYTRLLSCLPNCAVSIGTQTAAVGSKHDSQSKGPFLMVIPEEYVATDHVAMP